MKQCQCLQVYRNEEKGLCEGCVSVSVCKCIVMRKKGYVKDEAVSV